MGINHSSSCHAGSSCAVIPTSYSHLSLAAGSLKEGRLRDHQPCGAAQVLLLDGRVLHFPTKVRACHVLAGFRHHCLCPLDSATLTTSDDCITTFFKPVSLHPNDLLRPPCVYILLPRRMFCRFVAAAAAAAARNAGNGAPSSSRVCDSGAYSSSMGSKACYTHECSSTDSTLGNTQSTYNSRLGNIKPCPKISPHLHTNHAMPSDNIACGIDDDDALYHHTPCNNQTRCIPLQSNHIPTANGYIKPVQPASSTSQHLCSGITASSSLHLRPHRRTLYLHHASLSQHRRPFDMRKCRSWRPRLQAINEVHVYS